MDSGSPFLLNISASKENFNHDIFPFDIPAFSNGINIKTDTPVTFFVGENGSGKSTLIEALAECCGFNEEGGNRDHNIAVFQERSALAKALRLSWFPKTSDGFFMRAESFYDFTKYIESVSNMRTYGGKALSKQSHGESFLALFFNRFEQGIYLLDEPEAALSPQRQLAFLSIIHRLTAKKDAQFIIATHAPILLTFPNAKIISFDNNLQEINYEDTEHYNLTKDFLNNPNRYFKHLFLD